MRTWYSNEGSSHTKIWWKSVLAQEVLETKKKGLEIGMSIFLVLWEVSGSFLARVRWELSYVLKKILLSKPIQCTIPRMIHNVNYGLWIIIMCLCRFIIITNVLLMGMLWVMWEIQWAYENSLYFPLNFFLFCMPIFAIKK